MEIRLFVGVVVELYVHFNCQYHHPQGCFEFIICKHRFSLKKIVLFSVHTYNLVIQQSLHIHKVYRVGSLLSEQTLEKTVYFCFNFNNPARDENIEIQSVFAHSLCHYHCIKSLNTKFPIVYPVCLIKC